MHMNDYRIKQLEAGQKALIEEIISLDTVLAEMENEDLLLDVRKNTINLLHQFGYRQVGRDQKWLPLDICCCTLPETENWELEPEKMAAIERIESVYFFDRNEVTHLCEFTPSYTLYLIETRAIFKDQEGIDDDLQDAIDRDITGAITREDWISYVHTHEIDCLENGPEYATRWSHYGNPEVPMEEDETEEAFHDRVMDAMREVFQGNVPL